MSFNSSVWFNVACNRNRNARRASSNSVSDTWNRSLGLTRTKECSSKWGSGTGTNFSTLRGSKETLSGGGIASGPVSFMKGFDAFAGVIKSGGKTRRRGEDGDPEYRSPGYRRVHRMQDEGRGASACADRAGLHSSIDGDAYASIFFQNANHSVRVTTTSCAQWSRTRIGGQERRRRATEMKAAARDLMMKIADSTWHLRRSRMQYDTTVNRWHTSKNTARINASNPCSSTCSWMIRRATWLH